MHEYEPAGVPEHDDECETIFAAKHILQALDGHVANGRDQNGRLSGRRAGDPADLENR